MITSILGMPTGPDVRKLLAHFSDMQSLRGTIIEHKTLETLIGVKREDNRYKTVVSAWRREVKKSTGIWIRGDLPEVIGVGFRVLTDDEQVRFSGNRFQQAGRKIRDGHGAAANANDARLSSEMKAERDHLLRGFAKLHTAVIESRRFVPKQITSTTTNPRPETNENVG